MKEFTLDDEIQIIAPQGYLFCQKCGRYEHHPLKKCANCGYELIRAKHISIRTFLMITASHGAGPINTLFFHLFFNKKCDNNPYNDYDSCTDWRKKLYDEATEISDSSDSKQALRLYKEGKIK